MARVKRGTLHTKRRKHVLEYAKGFKWSRKNKLALARENILHAWKNAYRDRKRKKREFRALWQVQINAAVRERGMRYSQFIDSLKKHKIELDRRVMAELAKTNPEVFDKIVKAVKK